MESGRGRTPEERQAAAEARARARSGSPQTGDEDLLAPAGRPARAPEGISRYGGADYGRRRMVAIGVGVAVLFLLFLVFVGC